MYPKKKIAARSDGENEQPCGAGAVAIARAEGLPALWRGTSGVGLMDEAGDLGGDLGSGPASCSGTFIDACPSDCFWCVDMAICTDDWTACEMRVSAHSFPSLLSLAAIALFLVAVCWLRHGSLSADEEDDEDYRPQQQQQAGCAPARHDSSWSVVELVEPSRGDPGTWTGEAVSEPFCSERKGVVPEGQRLLGVV